MKFTKTSLLCFLLALLIVLPSSAKTYCVFAGVSHYNNPSISDLQLSTDDTKRLALCYKKSGATVRTLTGENATSKNILASIRMLQKRCKPEDQVVFFFSGHGYYNAMITYDYKECLYYYQLFEELRKINCGHVVVLVDACYSGTLFSTKGSDGEEYMNTDLEANAGNNEKFVIFSASRNTETSKESKSIRAGFFTNALLKGLYGSADIDKNREITVEELFTYIYYDVTKRISKQHPNLITNTEKNMNVVLMRLPEEKPDNAVETEDNETQTETK